MICMLTLAVVLAVVCVYVFPGTSARHFSALHGPTDPNREHRENRVKTVLKTVRKLFIISETR